MMVHLNGMMDLLSYCFTLRFSTILHVIVHYACSVRETLARNVNTATENLSKAS